MPDQGIESVGPSVVDGVIAPGADGGQFVVAHIADVRCGLPVATVREVHRAVAITPLPGAPAVVEGVVDVRGTLLPVIDGRRRLRRPPCELRLTDVLIHVRTSEREVLLRVDRVSELIDVEPDAIVAAPQVGAPRDQTAAILKTVDGLLVIANVAAFLDPAESAALDTALAEVCA